MGESGRKYGGFTLLELLVAITSSTVILGGFLVAFSSLNKSSRLRDMELKSLREGASVRMKIEKALTGASNAIFRTVSNDSVGGDVDMLYYYKYDDDNLLTEYGYFFLDEQQQSIDPSYQERLSDVGDPLVMRNLYFNKIDVASTDPAATAALPPDPKTFDLRGADREVIVHEASDFMVNLTEARTDEADKRVSYNLDYQVSTNFFLDTSSDATANRRERIFKGSSYVLGKITS
tara:strand:+ start:669 stop:1370 length:702 start_codon:yes stop_codon:yes gene_type:complete